MGFTVIELKLPTDFSAEQLERAIRKRLKTDEFSYTIEKKSLDARRKGDIHWLVRLGVSSPALKGKAAKREEKLHIPFKNREKRVTVVGSGPAGFFCAYVLLSAGFRVTIVEQGSAAAARLRSVSCFEQTGELDERNNYSFGEGGAGTFSDGKLTSRSKSISKERRFFIDRCIAAGAPEEIAYLAQPHVGSDNLPKIVRNLGHDFESAGGRFHLDTEVTGIFIKDGRVRALDSDRGKIDADYTVFAPGHSAYRTLRMLMRSGVPFRVKSFALGCRVEHPQQTINLAQWGHGSLAGVKAAEYRLTCKPERYLPVYTFCMCPGGQVVPAAPYRGLNIVNGKSSYARNRPLANAAVVAGIDLTHLLGRTLDALEALEWLESLERKFFDLSHSYAAPANRIADFLAGKISADLAPSSYPFPLIPADFKDLFPRQIHDSLRAGIKAFCKKIKGFDQGIMLGLESKTSAPIQALREPGGRCRGIDNLYICGEGSGHAGGIVSSAADGIKTAFAIIRASAP